MRSLFVMIIGLGMMTCGHEKKTTTVYIKDKGNVIPEAPRGPIGKPKTTPPSRGGGLSGGNNKSNSNKPKPKPPAERPQPPLPEPPEHKLPVDLWGVEDFYYNKSGRRWAWCDKLPKSLVEPLDDDWGWVPDSAEWCHRFLIYQVENGCPCRIKRIKG